MSDNINIGSIQAETVIAGGTNHTVNRNTVQSRNVEVHADLDGNVRQLRGLLDDLIRLSGQHAVSPRVRDLLSAAVAEAAKATLDISRLRALMDAVQANVSGTDPMGPAALNAINLINAIEEASQ